MKKKIVLIGGGGHCTSCIDVIESGDEYSIAGIVDMPDKLHQSILGYEIIASDADLPELAKDYQYFLITLGQIKSPDLRVRQFQLLQSLDVELPVIISPAAHVSRHAQLGQGSIVMHHAVVNANAVVGRNCIINTAAIIEHDARVGDHCHVSTGAIINGNASLGAESFLGSQSVLYQGVSIKEKSLISAASVVSRSLLEGRLFAGNPAEKIR